MVRPSKIRLFYDACVCIDAAKGNIPEEEWRLVSSFVSRKCRYYISPITVDELLRGVDRAGPEHFKKTKRALERLYPAHRKKTLPPPGVFINVQLFGRKLPYWLNEYKMDALIKAYIQSRDSDTLYSRRVWKGNRDTAVSKLVQTNLWYMAKFTKWQEDFEVGRFHGKSFSKEDWLEMVLLHCEQPDTVENRKRVFDSLNAQYFQIKHLFEMLKNQEFDVAKHSSDLVDNQHLSYLADPEMHFVTNDKKLRARISESAQGSRVWSWKDLYAIALVSI